MYAARRSEPTRSHAYQQMMMITMIQPGADSGDQELNVIEPPIILRHFHPIVVILLVQFHNATRSLLEALRDRPTS
jgi:hypothetical protein